MNYDFSELKKSITDVQEWLSKELLSVQTGRATPVLLDGVKVDMYGSLMPVSQVATVTTEDARTLRIAPWDKGSIQPLEAALRAADLGLGIAVDDQGLRLSFPELTTETREKYVKVVHGKLEEARISLRQGRDETWSAIQAAEKEGEMSEDDKFRAKDEMEKLVKEATTALADLAERKERDLMN